jgi:hypothetical protein
MGKILHFSRDPRCTVGCERLQQEILGRTGNLRMFFYHREIDLFAIMTTIYSDK